MDLLVQGFGVANGIVDPMDAVEAIDKERKDRSIKTVGNSCPDGRELSAVYCIGFIYASWVNHVGFVFGATVDACAEEALFCFAVK